MTTITEALTATLARRDGDELRDHDRPATELVRARDVKPYFWGQWCSIEGGAPFVNDICAVKWGEDGKTLCMMLESHNFITDLNPDEMMELVPLKPSQYHLTQPPFVLGDPPAPRVTMDSLRAQRDAAVEALEAKIPGNTHVRDASVEYGFACGRGYLSVNGIVVAMEGDICRDTTVSQWRTGSPFGGSLVWKCEDFKRIEAEFNAPLRAALLRAKGGG